MPLDPTPDRAAQIVEQWRAERPDLDPTPFLVIGRLHRVAAALTTELTRVYNEHGLGEGEFDVLATLRRQGGDCALTPSDLSEQTVVTSGAVTKRVDRLVTLGLVERRPSGTDGRSRLVALTPKGRDLIDRAFTAHMANEARLLEVLSPTERAGLERGLLALARSFGV
ncbi:transcriptional regulator [Knoellia flava TL1]|uniref:MarR family transcriptional regulator n=2 Tax=Knoellia flava TaxID=913969 RepID=A0A8H9KR57_9MICO|nr:MarR family transcriptional regulator [Knoellia flava]KGN30824.1 transcriptional regulator [Knoellia flava TL1]GGB84072.1 MarR family transcriptional regulator [Knoellia flava]